MRNEKNSNKKWTIEDDMFLEAHWGSMRVSTLAKRIGRSVRAVEHRAIALELGGMYEGSGHLNISDIVNMLGVCKSTVGKWIKNNGLKAKRVCLKKQPVYTIVMEDFIDWLRENPKKWHSGKLEVGCLGSELEKEEWLINKREIDSKVKPKREAYTPDEDKKILELYLSGYTAKEIAEKVNRPYDGVKHRITKMRNERGDIPYKNAKTQKLKRDN